MGNGAANDSTDQREGMALSNLRTQVAGRESQKSANVVREVSIPAMERKASEAITSGASLFGSPEVTA
jgi:hypothetical protein